MDILTYADYRAYLRDFIEERNRITPIWSYRFLASRLGIDHGQLVRIMQGKLHLPQRAHAATIKLCGLDGRKAAYFEELVRFSRTRSIDESSRSFERLAALRGVASGSISDDQSEYYTAWHHTVVRALLAMESFRGDWEAFGALCTPAITAAEASASAELLERIRMVCRDDDGTYHLVDSHVSTGAGVPDEAVRKFQRDTIDLANRALDEFPREEREFSTITMALSESDIRLVQGWVRDLRRKVQTLADSTRYPDRVFHLNVQLFPVARKTRRLKALPH